MSTQPENWEKLKDADYRHALAMAQFKRFVPFQIGALRKERDWSQEILASRAGVTQGVVSRAEDPDYGNLTVNTILRIANGFDLVFVGKFVTYSEFELWRSQLSESTVVLGFEDENAKFEKEKEKEKLLAVVETVVKRRISKTENDDQNKPVEIDKYKEKLAGRSQANPSPDEGGNRYGTLSGIAG